LSTGSWNTSAEINDFLELHYLPTSEAVLASPVSTVQNKNYAMALGPINIFQ